MKTPISFLALFLCFSLSLFGQKFNRSLTDFSLSPSCIVNISQSSYLADGIRSFRKYDASGNLVINNKVPSDSFFYYTQNLLRETDSTLIGSGIAINSFNGNFYTHGFILRLDTTLNIVDFKVLDVDSAYFLEGNVNLMSNGTILFHGGKQLYVLNHDFTISDYFENINSNSTNILSIPLINDSALVQRYENQVGQHFYVIDMGDSTELDITSSLGLNSNGTVELSDYSDSSFCILNNRNTGGPVELRFYRKDDFSLLHVFNVDSAAGFSVFEIKTFDDGIVGTSRNGKFVVLTGAYPFNVFSDSLRSGAFVSSVGQPSCYLSNGNVEFIYRVQSCQTHIESFPLSQRANTFGEVKLRTSIANASILGNAQPYPSDSLFYYSIEANIDVWVKNSSANFLDSLDLIYTYSKNRFSCSDSYRLKYQNINLGSQDSVMVSFVDTFIVHTYDTNIAVLRMGVLPIAANGNIVFPTFIDSVKQVFEGMSLKETKLADFLEIYPSPVSESLNIDLKGAGVIDRVTVFSITGQQILTQEIYDTKAELNVNALKSGIYILTTEVDGEIHSQRFVKQ